MAWEAIEQGDWATYGSYVVDSRKNKLIARVSGFVFNVTIADKGKRKELEDLLKSHNFVDPDEEGVTKPDGVSNADFAVSKVSDTNALLSDLIAFMYENADQDDIRKWPGFTIPRKGGVVAKVSQEGDKASAIFKHPNGGSQKILMENAGGTWRVMFVEEAPRD